MSSTESNSRKDLFGIDRRVIALGMACMADSFGNSFLIVVLPLYISSGNVTGKLLNLPDALITGIVLGLFGLVSSICQPMAGRLSDRAGKRRMFVLLGLALFTVANFSYLLVHSYLGLLAIRIVQGIAAALTITASLALVSEVSKSGNRGGNMGVYNSFRLIGFGIGPLASGVLIEAAPYNMPLVGQVNGFTASFCVATGAAVVSAVLVSIMVQDPEETEASTEKMVIRIRSEKSGRLLDSIFALGLATFIMSTGFALLTAIESAVNKRLSQGAFMFSVEFSALVGTLALVQPFIGKASDRYGRKAFILVGLIGLVPITFLEGLATASWQMIVARALQGICAAAVFAPALALAGDLADEGQVGAQLSVLTVAFGLGISFGAVLSGFAIRFGFLTPFVIGSGLSLIGAILVYTQVAGDATAKA